MFPVMGQNVSDLVVRLPQRSTRREASNLLLTSDLSTDQ